MATPALGPNDEKASVTELREMLAFLREENQAARKAFVDDSEATRRFFRHTAWIVSLPLSVLLVIAAFLGIKSFHDVMDEGRQEFNREIKGQKQEMAQVESDEISRIREDVKARLTEEFKTPVIRRTVDEAARRATSASALPLIKSAVSTQVSKNLEQERAGIQKAVAERTQKALSELGGKIDAAVRTEVENKVSSQLGPVADKVATVKSLAEVQGLLLRMSADDAGAFDILNHMDLTHLDPEMAKIIRNALINTQLSYDSMLIMERTFTTPQPDDVLIGALSNESPNVREAALDALGKKPDLLPLSKLVELIKNDPSLRIRTLAHRQFNSRTKQGIGALYQDLVDKWCAENAPQCK